MDNYNNQMDYNQMNYNMPPQNDNKGSVGLAVTSMILGILGFLMSCCVPVLPIVMCIIGLLMGIAALVKKHSGKGMAIAGVILNGLTVLIAAVVLLVFGAAMVPSMMGYMEAAEEAESSYSYEYDYDYDDLY